MLVSDCMTRDVHTLAADATVADGLRLMNDRSIHRLPVVDAASDLLGIVSDMDLRIAEAAGRLADPVSAIMTRRVVTVSEYTPLEQAATTMRRKGIGGLPVVRGTKLIGIITDGDIFDVFAQLLGVGRPGVRLTVAVAHDRDVLLDLLTAIREENGEVVAVGTVRRGDASIMVLKVAGLGEDEAQRAVSLAGVEIADVLTEA